MRLSIKFIIACPLIVQLTFGCGASLPEQCKQIQMAKSKSPESTNLPMSKQNEIQSEHWSA